MFYLGAFLTALLTSLLLTRAVRSLAIARGWAVTRKSKHHIHSQPVPRLGGVAIVLSFSFVIALAIPIWRMAGHELLLDFRHLAALIAPALVIFALGLWDDFRGLGPWIKIVVQAFAGYLLYLGGFGISEVSLVPGGLPSFVGVLLTIGWVIGITNAFNLLDGLDGLAAGSAVFSTVVVLLVALLNGSLVVAILAAALAGATLGFLRFNFNPATIFLGDCGSLFLGFMLSAMALGSAAKSPALISIGIPLVSFGLPVVDTMLAVVRRFLSGRPVFGADDEHIHHKLLRRGLSHRQVVITLYGVTAAFGAVSLLLFYSTSATIAVVLIATGAVIAVGVHQLGYHELFEIGRVARRTIDQKRVIVNNLAIRRAAEELAAAGEYDAIVRILDCAFEHNEFDSVALEAAPACIIHEWTRQGHDAAASGWHLILDLPFPNGESVGRLHLRRACLSKELMMDVNLLAGAFRSELAAALGRAHRVPVAQPLSARVFAEAAGQVTH